MILVEILRVKKIFVIGLLRFKFNLELIYRFKFLFFGIIYGDNFFFY